MIYSQIKAILILCIVSFSTAAKYSYTSSSFSESARDINNPDQGFYKALRVTFKSNSLEYSREKADQLYHIRCDMSEFSKAVNKKQDKELSSGVLVQLQLLLSQLKKENKNAIIRFSYDKGLAGNANHEPSMSMIRRHIQQLGNVLKKYPDVLVAIETGLIGPYGEMHSSKIATEENKVTLIQYWLQNVDKTPILNRTPYTIYKFFN